MSRQEARLRGSRPAAGAVGYVLAALTVLTIVGAVYASGVARAAAATPDPPTCAAPPAARLAASAGRPFWPRVNVNQRRAVTVLFLPGPVGTPAPVLTDEMLKLPGFAVGLFSPTIGKYGPTQMLLDISQGSRAASSLYRPVSPASPGLIVDPRTAGGRFKDWNALMSRATSTPADLHPGLLGCAVEKTGLSIAWTGAESDATVTAIAAVAGDGGVRLARVVPGDALVASIETLQRRFAVVAAALPPGGFGLGAIRRLAADRPDRMMIVVQAPPNPARTRLLAIAVRGIGGDGGLKSASTRRDGLVADTDVAATVLQRVGAARPKSMQGRPIESAARMSSEDLQKMSARLELVASRRTPFGSDVMVLYLMLLAGVLLVGRISGRRREPLRRLSRLVALSMFWLPAMLLLTAALRPSRATEVDLAAFGSLGLAMVNDRLIRWPRGPWLPVLVVLAAYGTDFALLGSRLTGESLLGPNPLYGARFFGAGNELEITLTVSALVATGAFVCDRRARTPAYWFAGVGAATAMFLGLGRLGADVGGVIAVAAGFGVAVLYAARARLTFRRAALLALLAAAGLALVALLDSLTGGESHLARTFQDSGGASDLLAVIVRRFRASIESAHSTAVLVLVLLSIAALTWGWIRRERLFAPLALAGDDAADRRPLRAALVGGVSATVVGALVNDSGPAILIIGTVYLLMAVFYVRGRPPAERNTLN